LLQLHYLNLYLYQLGKIREKDKKLRKYDFQKLYEVTYQTTINLNQVIDVNFDQHLKDLHSRALEQISART